MRILLIIFYLLQSNFTQIETLRYNQTIEEQMQSRSVVETVKVVIREKVYLNDNLVSFEDSFRSMLDDIASLGWRLVLSILLIILMGYVNYKLNRFYNKYDLAKKIKNADFLKVVVHIIIWLITGVVIIFIFLKSSILVAMLFLLFIFIVLIISVSDLSKNVIGGILILLDKPFEYGDWIKIGEYSGKVHSKNLRNTEIITEDDSLIKIPNSYFVTHVFENLNIISKNKQVSFVVEVSPHTEISKIKSSLYEITALSIFNSINKPVEVIYKGINERGNMEFQIRAYVFDARYENEFKSDVQESIAEYFGMR